MFVGGGYAGLEALAELQDFAADAMDSYPRARLQGMRWILVEATDRVLPEIDLKLAEYAARELRGRGIDIRLGTRLESVEPGRGDALAPASGSPPGRWSGRRASRRTPASRELSVPLDDHGRVRVDEYMRVEGMDGVWALGDCAAVPDPSAAMTQAVAADRSARDPPGPDGGAKRGRRARHRQGRAVPLSQQGRVRQPGSLQGGRPAGPVHVLGIPGLVDGAHVPHEPDPGHGAQDPRRRRLDRRPAVPAATSPRSARSATRGRSAPRSTRAAAAIARSPEQARRPPLRQNPGMAAPYLIIALSFGIATGVIGRAKGSSFFIWLIVGSVLPVLGLIAVILYRPEIDEPERRCPRCGKVHKLYVQVCTRCGAELYLPDPSDQPQARAGLAPGRAAAIGPMRRIRPRALAATAARFGRSRSRSRARSGPRPASSSGRACGGRRSPAPPWRECRA